MSDQPTWERAERTATAQLVLFTDVTPEDRETVPCWLRPACVSAPDLSEKDILL
jgi:hypothetical protein